MKKRRKCRRIDRLQEVEKIPKGPWPEVRLKGTQLKGIRYEKQVARRVAELYSEPTLHAQWFKFRDRKGRGFAQPDIFVLFPDIVLLLEVKLTQRRKGMTQLRHLYSPLLERYYERPVAMVQ